MTPRKVSVECVIDCVLACILLALLCCCYASLRTVSRHIRLTPAETLLIHFIETSSAPELSVRQCCVLESAARLNKNSKVILWVLGEVTIQDLCGGLDDRITTENYTPELFFTNTPLIIWLARVEARAFGFRTHFLPVHLGDALRLAVLYSRGGFYMDLDVLNLKSIEDLPRTAVAKEDATRLGNSFLAFPRGHRFLRHAMDEFATTYKGTSWAHNGPRLLERVLSKWGCDFNSNRSCSDITILEHLEFYPVPYSDWKTILTSESERPGTKKIDLSQSHGIHLWNSISQRFSIEDRSTLHSLARVNCPITERRGIR